MDRKLIFLDIDGTLTPAGSNVPPASALEAIRKARENGHLEGGEAGRGQGRVGARSEWCCA